MHERMLDGENRPNEAELAARCGESGRLFEALNAYLTEAFATSREIRFPYGKKYGWCVTHRKGKKLVCDIFAETGSFTVMARMTGAAFASVYDGLTEYSRRCVDDSYPCGEGGWIRYRVEREEQLADIRKLLEAKLG